MALDLGELSGRIGLDINPLKRDLAASKTALRGHVADAEQAGEDAGESFTEGWGDKAKQGATVAAAAVAGAMVYGINKTLEREAGSDKLAASLGLDPKAQARAGRVAGNLYAGAWGESMGEVNTALGAVMSSFDGMAEGSRRQLRGLTIQALDYATTFEVDVARGVQVASQLVTTGLAKNATEAYDLLTASSQRVPAAVREDLLDASDEYGQFFAGLGYTGQEAFATLVKASEDGMYGIDKAGDAVKEFTIRSTDMSTASKDAYDTIGLSAREMADDILAGGDDARRATEKIIDGLLAIESPSKRAEAAIALFGTPLEDLNVKEIPDFLRGLRRGSREMDNFKGSTKEMGETLNDNNQTSLTEFKRGMETKLVKYLESDVIPFLQDDLFPAMRGIGDALDNVPSWAVKGSVAGLFGLIAAGKLGSLMGNLRGLRGGGLGGGLGGGIGKAAPVPVFVTNPGFGGPGTPVVAGDPSKTPKTPVVAAPKPSMASRAASFGAKAFLPATLFAAGWQMGGDEFGKGGMAHGQGILGGNIQGLKDDVDEATDHMTASAREALAETARAFREADIPTELKTDIALNGVPESMADARALVKQYDLTPREKTTLFKLLGYDTLASQIRWINTNLDHASRDRRTQITIAYSNAGYQTKGGPQEKAGGGPVTRGVPYIVGEREPELFVPHTSGRIFNQQQMQQGGVGARVVDRTPKRLILETDLGPLVARVVRDEVDDHDEWRESLR